MIDKRVPRRVAEPDFSPGICANHDVAESRLCTAFNIHRYCADTCTGANISNNRSRDGRRLGEYHVDISRCQCHTLLPFRWRGCGPLPFHTDESQTGECVQRDLRSNHAIRWLERALQNITKVIMDGGWLVVSLLYSTIRLFPERSKYGRIVSCEGRLCTHIPFYWIQPMLTLMRVIYRILRGRFRDAFEYVKIREWRGSVR
jgi:hypothetical protein